jgi:hypothetical protein
MQSLSENLIDFWSKMFPFRTIFLFKLVHILDGMRLTLETNYLYYDVKMFQTLCTMYKHMESMYKHRVNVQTYRVNVQTYGVNVQ